MIGRRLTALPLLLCLLLVASAAPAQISIEDRKRAFKEANAAFHLAESIGADNPRAQRESYLRAARRYEWLIRDGGLSNSQLYFNQANSLLGAEDYGRAILNYRRALLLSPGDHAVEQNLAVARERRSDYRARTSSSHWSVAGRYIPGVSVAIWLLFWGLLVLRLYRPRWLQPTMLLAVGVTTVIAIGLTIAVSNGYGFSSGVVTVRQSVARQGDGLSFETALAEPVRSGAEFRVLESGASWSRVELSSGETVWLSRNDFELVEDMP